VDAIILILGIETPNLGIETPGSHAVAHALVSRAAELAQSHPVVSHARAAVEPQKMMCKRRNSFGYLEYRHTAGRDAGWWDAGRAARLTIKGRK
jgi:hypothetical protein